MVDISTAQVHSCMYVKMSYTNNMLVAAGGIHIGQLDMYAVAHVPARASVPSVVQNPYCLFCSISRLMFNLEHCSALNVSQL